MRKPDAIEVAFELPGVALRGCWTLDDLQRKAAWEIYVELVTRVATIPLGEEEGLLREALSSLHSLFGTTREVLRRYGPDLAHRRAPGKLTLGEIAVAVLNAGLRPFLAKWHPLLEDHESARPPGVSRLQHERAWDRAPELRRELQKLRGALDAYAGLLEDALSGNGVVSLRYRPVEEGDG